MGMSEYESEGDYKQEYDHECHNKFECELNSSMGWYMNISVCIIF